MRNDRNKRRRTKSDTCSSSVAVEELLPEETELIEKVLEAHEKTFSRYTTSEDQFTLVGETGPTDNSVVFSCVCVCVCVRACVRVCVRARVCMCLWPRVYVGACQCTAVAC